MSVKDKLKAFLKQMIKFRRLFYSFLLSIFVLCLTGCSNYADSADDKRADAVQEPVVIDQLVEEPAIETAKENEFVKESQAVVKPPVAIIKTKAVEGTVTEPLEDVDYYTNVDGDTIQSPTYYSSEPQGATALCRDGTYSFSAHRSGTCSHHGGVESWL